MKNRDLRFDVSPKSPLNLPSIVYEVKCPFFHYGLCIEDGPGQNSSKYLATKGLKSFFFQTVTAFQKY